MVVDSRWLAYSVLHFAAFFALDCSLCHISGYYLLVDPVRLATCSAHLGGKSSVYFKLNLSSPLVADLVNSVCFWLHRVNT